MKLKVKAVGGEFINSGEDYTVTKIMGFPVLVYGDGRSKKKSYNGIAFKNTELLREVAKNLLSFADFLDAQEEKSE